MFCKSSQEDILWNSCFLNTYGIALLKDGYGFKDDNIIRFADEIAGYKVGWALGSMLYEVRMHVVHLLFASNVFVSLLLYPLPFTHITAMPLLPLLCPI